MAGLYAYGKVGNVSVNCLVDTGATVTVISENLWLKLKSKNKITPFELSVSSTSGDLLKVKGQTEIDLRFKRHLYKTKVVVAEIGNDVVLGLDFMQQYGVCIDVIRNTMKLKGHIVNLYCTGKIGCFGIDLSDEVDKSSESTTVKCRETGPEVKQKDNVQVETKRKQRKNRDRAKHYESSILSTSMAGTKTSESKGGSVKNGNQIMQPLCPVCKTSISETVNFEGHITECRKRDEKRRTCTRCSKVFLKLQYLKRHMKIKHGLESDFQR
ncbi:retroviral-like aspartic protease 1 [Ruditapes philippinarum]|uniref:retroviral-like aspartic protease 1 n=1 Tax=Ruditapes philippinarum TaxID=129788 RepID=UPI00295AF0C7|nr:retroviral-like aspartic protease 1 [Ruditapes philippinarum]